MNHFQDFASRRAWMVENQIVGRGISAPLVVSAMSRVPREKFVGSDLVDSAYDDGPLPIGHGQTISQPYIVALMAEALDLTGGDVALDIGTGSGYAAAVLASIAARVYSIERIPELAESAAQVLADEGYGNVVVRCGDGTLGWPEQAPFDGICVAAGAPVVPEALRQQLRVGGHLVIPVGSAHTIQSLRRITRLSETEFRTTTLCDVRFVPLLGEQGWS
ncbi:protein-L-isoaspartate(D-aspartate) O-methyltransferase [Marinobacter mobilis]|uniref:protein-L-isoaspartate(D-aspartate) O-methyltransferase n=1 Tax=Marinobacter mobilis TaxID=488533 RepID=UPI0035C729F3